jgi:hypothetical protein
MKWPQLAPKSRRSTAEALTTVTFALATRRRGAPEAKTLRRALFGWAFNPGTRNLTPPADIAAALEWVAAASQSPKLVRTQHLPPPALPGQPS